MTTEPLGIELPEISHFAFVVEDLYEAMDAYANVLGVGPWEVKRFEPPNLAKMTYRGEEADFSMRIGKASVEGGAFELIEPLSGESYYTEQLETRGPGLNHMACFGFESPRAVKEALTDAGFPVVMSGSFLGGQFWYIDTSPVLGTAFEVTIPREREFDGTEVYDVP